MLVDEYVVDMMRWDRHKRVSLLIIFRDDMRDFDISKMADMVAKPVKTGGLGAVDRRTQRRSEAEMRNEVGPLVWIRGSENSIVHP